MKTPSLKDIGTIGEITSFPLGTSASEAKRLAGGRSGTARIAMSQSRAAWTLVLAATGIPARAPAFAAASAALGSSREPIVTE